jgi:hypothetical protein
MLFEKQIGRKVGQIETEFLQRRDDSVCIGLMDGDP